MADRTQLRLDLADATIEFLSRVENLNLYPNSDKMQIMVGTRAEGDAESLSTIELGERISYLIEQLERDDA